MIYLLIWRCKKKWLVQKKICTRNQEKEAREDETSEWDCVTEGNRKICIKHGAENGTRQYM